MIAIRILVLCGAALFVAACLPVTTKHPVGSTAGFKPDPALLGLWKGHGDDRDPGEPAEDAYFAFLRSGDGAITVILITPEKDGDDWGTFHVEAATLGANHFMNVHGELKNGKPDDDSLSKENILFLYSLGADGKLTLTLLDEKATAAAIMAGRIAGTVDPGSMGDVHITAEPAALDAFFATKEGAALFSAKFVTLTKLE